MDKQDNASNINQKLFFDAIKKAYEKGTNEKEVTVRKIIEELKVDLKSAIID